MKLSRKELRSIIAEMAGGPIEDPMDIPGGRKFNNLHLKQAFFLLLKARDLISRSGAYYRGASRYDSTGLDYIVSDIADALRYPDKFDQAKNMAMSQRAASHGSYLLQPGNDPNLIITLPEREANIVDDGLSRARDLLKNMFEYATNPPVGEPELYDVFTFGNIPGIYGVQKGNARGLALEILKRGQTLINYI